MHLPAAAAMLWVLRRGLETNPDLQDRLAFIDGQRGLWRTAWFAWNLAALSVVYFFFRLARAHRDRRAVQAAFWTVVAAAAADLSAEGIEMFSLPGLAARGPAFAEGFLYVHRFAVLLTGCWANALYTAGVALALAGLWGESSVWSLSAGAGVVVLGFSASAAVWSGSPGLMLATNALLVPCLLAWLAGVGLYAAEEFRGHNT